MSAADTMGYTTTLEPLPREQGPVPVPFDPDEVWGTKREHHVGGAIEGGRVRGSIRKDDDGWSFSVSLCDRPISPGDVVNVVISPGGPTALGLGARFPGSTRGEPRCRSVLRLAQFYRKGYLRWMDATKRRPDVRAERIAEVIRLLNAGIKERPRP